jgi:hypothetical protein
MTGSDIKFKRDKETGNYTAFDGKYNIKRWARSTWSGGGNLPGWIVERADGKHVFQVFYSTKKRVSEKVVDTIWEAKGEIAWAENNPEE